MHITQNENSAKALYAIKEYFGCGVVKTDNKQTNTLKYQISSYKEINSILIPFLDKYPLLTSKRLNYLTFKKAINMMLNKEHLTVEGINKLQVLSQSMNKNRTFADKFNFCQNNNIDSLITPQWIAGFVDGEGCFYFYIGKQTNTTILLQASLEIGQNPHDLAVLWGIKRYFNCGRIKPKSADIESYTLESAQAIKGLSRFIISNTSDIQNIIIPFFDKYSLLTNKSLDYLDWKELINMKLNKLHLTPDGLLKMKLIKSKMNAGRM